MQLFIGWANKHVLHEMRLPGDFGDEANGKAGIGVGAAESINDEQTLTGKLLGDEGFQMLPGLWGDRFVVVLPFAIVRPPQGVAGGVVTDNVFILRRTAGKDTGVYSDCARVRQYTALVSFQCWIELLLIQRSVIGVIDDVMSVVDTISLEILRG
ncbi:hypothetical protein D3C75_612700 [compost metagenome]